MADDGREKSGKLAICDYWTKERIFAAIPKEKVSPEDRVLSEAQQSEKVQANVTEVPDSDRTKFPYQAIGKLTFKMGLKKFCGSAFGVNENSAKNIIFTAAHNLWDSDGKATDICFIPAMQDNGDAPYEKFEQIDGGEGVAWFVPDQWDPISQPDPYEIGAVKLKRNARGKELGDEVRLLKVKENQVLVADETKWNIVGYNGVGKMLQTEGTFLRAVEDGKKILRNKATGTKGMSGSPWLLPNNEANADHAGSNVSKDYSFAPYYSKALIDEMRLKLKK